MPYFIIYQHDTEATAHEITKKEIIELVEDHPEIQFIESNLELKKLSFDPAYWADKYLLIKGEVVTPKPVQKVTTWEID